jgi:DNA-binding NarL/FixJ family response regulator
MSSRIFIISDRLMFGQGLECLLVKEKAVEVVGRGTSVKEAATLIRTLQPDVIIVDNDEITLDAIAELLRMVNSNPCIKIIHLSLQSNNLYVYQAIHTRVQSVADLVEAIKEV